MTDAFGVGSFFASMMTWLESRKQRKLLEKMTELPPVGKPRRRPRVSKAVALATTALAEENRRQKLQLERDKHEWLKNRDIAKALRWLFEQMDKDE